MSRRLGLVALLLSLVLPTTASAWCRMTTSLRQPSLSEPCVMPDPLADPPELFLAWTRPCTSIALGSVGVSRDLTSAEVRSVLERSVAAWEAVACDGSPLNIDMRVLDDTTTCEAPLYRNGGGNVNSLIFQQTWPAMNEPSAFALTTVWHRRSTGEILDADIEVNEQQGPFGICPDGGCMGNRTVDLENVLTHELGHYLGLAHSTEPEATMFVSAVAGEVLKRDLHPDDVAGICSVYPPGASTAECNHEPIGGLDLDCDDGCSVGAVGARRSPLAGWLALVGLVWARRQSSRARRATS